LSAPTLPSRASATAAGARDGPARDTEGRAAAQCPHCGTPVEGTADAFCCTGCEVASLIISDAGLERYYAERTAFAPRPEAQGGVDWNALPIARGADGRCETRLMVEGLRCASCVWVTERVLERTPGVTQATVSYATGRATLRWDPAQVDLAVLARRIGALGYRPRPLGVEASADRSLLLRLGVAGFAAMNIMLLATTIYAGWWDGMDQRYAALFQWTTLILATPVALWCAQPFFAGAWSGLRHGVLHMDLPIALGVAILYLQGLVATLAGREGYLDSLAMLVFLLLAGRVLESRGRRRAAEAATALVGMVPRTARRLRSETRDADGTGLAIESMETVAVGDLHPGDRIDTGTGEEIAADGIVLEGSAQVKMALLTGEAAPVLLGPGDRVVAGTVLVDGALTTRVEAVGADSVVHRMAAELALAQDRGTAPTSADRIAPWFTAITLLVASLTLASWWVLRGSDVAIARTVAVLVVACPCALALSQPLAAAAGLGAAARRGLLLRSSDALLRLGHVTVVGLDKTGTITTGTLSVTAATDATLRLAAGLERYSAHPIAAAIIAETARRRIPLPAAAEVREVPGQGISGVVDGARYEIRSSGPGAIDVLGAQGVIGTVQLGDVARADSGSVVQQFERLGVRAVMITGDHSEVAERFGRDAGVGEILARTLPAAKSDWVRQQQASGERVLFAGDGLNDGPALAAADVGIAMARGAASSVLVADGIISTESLAPVIAGIRAARAAERVIHSSQRRSIIYNVLAVAAAAAGLVNPLVAAILMPLSSSMVIWNAARVERIIQAEEACVR